MMPSSYIPLFRQFAVLLAFLAIYSPARSQQLNDSTLKARGFWDSRAVNITVVPAVLFAGSAALWGERKNVRELRNRYIPTFRYHFDDYMQYVPALAVFGLNAAGVKGKNHIGRAFVSYAFSAVVMGAVVNGIKYTAKVERPDGSERNSFPSGHTANSFMNATFLHKEYGQYRHPMYSVAGYTLATGTAIGRQLNNRHWVSDVLAGAGIGILATEVGYLIADRIYRDKGARPVLHKDPIPVDGKPSFIEIRMGYAIATTKDLTGNVNGVSAKRGFNMGAEGAWFFHRNIGAGAEFAFTSFPINDDGLIITDPDVTVISDGHYTQPMGIRYLHAGPFFSIPLPKNWFITGKALAGTSLGSDGNVMLRLNPDWQELLERNDFPYLRYKPEGTFSWSAGIGIQKRISRNIGVKAYGAYFDSDHDFDIDIVDDVTDEGKFLYKNIGQEKVRFNHFTFGLGLTAFLW
ncbi:phosphatase PAP2 family protein [Chitinophaga deserti]|uniref:phosphatase PAP2 family protein n=1 Tax=Chitinophaga deserti TaxID=2164099 RepID=UPI000D6C92A7|nr:phosphatase PAP2 family protein [Chitinophaga deserti]